MNTMKDWRLTKVTNKIQELKNTLRERGFCILEVEQEFTIYLKMDQWYQGTIPVLVGLT